MSVDILYTSNKKEDLGVQQVLQSYINSLRLIFPGHHINYSIEYDNTTELLTTITIPAKLTISNTIKGL